MTARQDGPGATVRSLPAPRTGEPPVGNRFVVRDRLVEALVAPRFETTILISGAAGSGKSTLARQWLQRDGRARAEIRASPALASPARLAEALVEALESLGPAAGGTRLVPTASEPFFSAILLPALTDLAETRPEPYVVVVDDVHQLTDPACHLLLQAVASGVPEGSALALLSQERSPSWLSRTLAEGRLLTLGAEAIAFDVEEASALFRGMDCAVPETEVARAVRHSGGWAVALYLGALGLRSRPPAAREEPVSLPRGPDHDTGAYVRSQILDHLDDDTREFLVRSSILDELEPDLCDAVLGRSDSARVLAWLHERLQLDTRGGPIQAPSPAPPAAHRDAHGGARARTSTSSSARCTDGRPTGSSATATSTRPSGTRRRPATCRPSGHWSGTRCTRASDRVARTACRPGWERCPRTTSSASAGSAWPRRGPACRAATTVRMERWLRVAADHAGRGWRDASPPDEYAGSLASIEALVGRDGLDDVLALCSIAVAGLSASSPFQAPSASSAVSRSPSGATWSSAVASLQEAVRLGRALEVPVIVADSLGLARAGEPAARVTPARGSP